MVGDWTTFVQKQSKNTVIADMGIDYLSKL